MFAELTGLGYTIIGFTILVVIGIVVIGQLGASVANCPAGWPTYNVTSQLCQVTANASNTTAVSVATSTSNTINTYLGTSGLSGWIPAIIALFIGILFLSAFGFGKKTV